MIETGMRIDEKTQRQIVIELTFCYLTSDATIIDIMEWMINTQLGRRNLSPIQRIAVAEKYRPIYEKQARENKSINGGDKKSELQNSSTPIKPENKIDVRAKLAQTANVSTDTYSKGKKILDSNNDEVKNAVLSGDMSINAGYNKIRESEKKKENIKEASPITNMKQIKPPLQPKPQISDEVKQICADLKTEKTKEYLDSVWDYKISIIKDLLETNIRQRGDIGGSAKKVGKRIRELERLYGIEHGGDRKSKPNNSVLNNSQSDLATQLGISVDTLQNYKMLADMIPELEDLMDTGIVTKTTALAMMRNLSEDLQDEDSKLRALISNNFGRRKNDPSKDRKALETYVSLRGYKHGEIGGGHQRVQNGLSGLTLDEIAKELNMSKTNLKRALRIERNLTDSMKELLDSGEITKTLAADTIASMSEEEEYSPLEINPEGYRSLLKCLKYHTFL